MNTYIITIEIGAEKELHERSVQAVDAEDAQEAVIDAIEAEGRMHGNIKAIRCVDVI